MESGEFTQKFHEAEYEAYKDSSHIYSTVSDPPKINIYAVIDGVYMNISHIDSKKGRILIHILKD